MGRQYDIENERAIVSSSLTDAVIRKRAVGSVRAEQFLGERFRVLFHALAECERQDLIPDNEAIAVQAGEEDYGGYEFLNKLRKLEPVANLDFHLDRLRHDAARAQAADKMPELARLFDDRTKNHDECLRAASGLVSELRVAKIAQEDVTEEYSKDLDRRCAGELPFVSCGYKSLDPTLLEGYAPGLLTVLAGRTGNGKSTLVVDKVRRLLGFEKKPRILMIPLEIGRIRFLDKLVSSCTMLPLVLLRKSPEDLTLAERDEIKRVVKKLVGTDDRLVVMDKKVFFESGQEKWSNDVAMDRIESILAEGDYSLVIFDLFQRCLRDLRPAAVEETLIWSQYLADKYSSHLLFVHQISRKAEERRGKRPELSDLKGSGGYEEVPDLIELVHRPKAYKQFMKKDLIEVKIGKQRDGPAGQTMVAEFLPTVSRLENDRLAGRNETDGEDDEEATEDNEVF